MNPFASVTRGRFLKLAGLGSGLAAGLGLPGRVDAAEVDAAEKANLKLVNDFCASLEGRDMTKIAAFLAEDCVYRVMETAAPARGKKETLDRIRSYVERSTKVEIKILESWVKGPVVVNERIDSFEPKFPNSPFHLTGFFFIRDGKIAEWTDYVIRP